MPKISVIVPIYKAEKYLPKCIDSILGQTFSDFELILVDDGSPDGCGAICDEYEKKDSRLCVIHLENGGVAAARNAGLDIARGEWVAFCDSDDYWAADYLEVMYGELLKTGADIVSCSFSVVSEDGTELRAIRYEARTADITTQEQRNTLIIVDIPGFQWAWSVWTKLFRRELIQTHGIRFRFAFAEDLAFLLECCLYCKKMVSIDYKGYYYYIHEDSAMQFGKDILRLNEMNNISKHLYSKIQQEELRALFPIVHYRLLDHQYEISRFKDYYKTLNQEIGKIEDQAWYREQTRGLFARKKQLRKMLGKEKATKALLLSKLCLDGNWQYYHIVSAFAEKSKRQYYWNKLLHR